MNTDNYIAALHHAMRADHEESVAEVQGWADAAAARGDTAAQRRHEAHRVRLEALPKPWERTDSAA